MGAIRDDLINKLWRGTDPFADFPHDAYAIDGQGWASQHHFLTDFISEGPLVVAELGVWKGSSTIHMALKMKELGIDGAIIAVDTWLGSAEHWVGDEWYPSLGMDRGYPTLQRTFMANVQHWGVQDYIVPLPLDSFNAAELVRPHGITLDALHIDAGHDYRSASSDLHAWWPHLRQGGMLIGDDYCDAWPEVVKAYDEFFAGRLIERSHPKCRVVKAAALSLAA